MKKQSLFLSAVGAVAALGIGANIKTIPVHAEESGSVTISVNVNAPYPSVTISGITQNGIYSNPKFRIGIDYNDAEEIDYLLVYEGEVTEDPKAGVPEMMSRMGRAASDRVVYQLPSTLIEQDKTTTGSYHLNLDLNDYGGKYGGYTFYAINRNKGAEDSVFFIYAAASAPVESGEDEAGNPTIEVEVSEETEKVEVDIIDEDGKIVGTVELPIKDGKVEINISDISAQIPGGLKDGATYTIKVNSYDKYDNLLFGNTSFTVDYKALVGTPETGNPGFTGELSASDLSAAFLVLFVAVVLGGLYALKKTSGKTDSKRNRR